MQGNEGGLSIPGSRSWNGSRGEETDVSARRGWPGSRDFDDDDAPGGWRDAPPRSRGERGGRGDRGGPGRGRGAGGGGGARSDWVPRGTMSEKQMAAFLKRRAEQLKNVDVEELERRVEKKITKTQYADREDDEDDRGDGDDIIEVGGKKAPRLDKSNGMAKGSWGRKGETEAVDGRDRRTRRQGIVAQGKGRRGDFEDGSGGGRFDGYNQNDRRGGRSDGYDQNDRRGGLAVSRGGKERRGGEAGFRGEMRRGEMGGRGEMRRGEGRVGAQRAREDEAALGNDWAMRGDKQPARQQATKDSFSSPMPGASAEKMRRKPSLEEVPALKVSEGGEEEEEEEIVKRAEASFRGWAQLKAKALGEMEETTTGEALKP